MEEGKELKSPEYVKRTALMFETNGKSPTKIKSQATDMQASSINRESVVNGSGSVYTGKKPSYLGLACSISGYGGITTYDSKLREGFRSRDLSPGRLCLTRSREVSPLRTEVDGTFNSKFSSRNYLVPPTKQNSLDVNILSYKTQDNSLGCQEKSSVRQKENGIHKEYLNNGSSVNGILNGHEELIRQSKLKYKTSESFDYDDKQNCPKNSISSEVYLNNNNVNIHVNISSPKCIRKNYENSSTRYKSNENLVDVKSNSGQLSNRVSVISKDSSCSFDSPSHTKSHSKDSLSVSLSNNSQKSPGTVKVVEFTSQTKCYVQRYSPGKSMDVASSSSKNNDVPVHEEEIAWLSGGSKSFIQQRIERLYGPGALAQGFFKKNRPENTKTTESEHNVAMTTSSLPVLKHLRPEFRAQLNVANSTSLKGSKSGSPICIRSTVPTVLIREDSNRVIESSSEAHAVILPVDHSQSSEIDEKSESPEEKNGHFFLKILKNENQRLTDLVKLAEIDLMKDLPEEALGKLRSAIGQANLLMKQKMQQFEGLCQKNISQSPDEQFPTTNEDLAGFWDMVLLQVSQVDGLFKEINELRASNWQEEIDKVEIKRPSIPNVSRRSSKVGSSVKYNADANKLREEARKKMIEEKRKAMKKNRDKNDSVEIFIPEEKGK